MAWFGLKCNKMCNRWFIYLTSSTSCTIRKWTGSIPRSAICPRIGANIITTRERSVFLPFAIKGLIKARRSVKHKTLWKQEKWCNIGVDDRSSSDDIGQRQEWCETFSLMMTMSIIIIQNAWTIQHPFKDSNNRDNAPSSRGENNKKIKIPTAPSHLQNRFRC